MDTLSLFNQQVLQCQDDAYTLAWYLLADETKAEAAVQAAVMRVYGNNLTGKQRCRLSILSAVIQQCQERQHSPIPVSGSTSHPWIMRLLQQVSAGERLVLILVDILDLRPPEAAELAGISHQNFHQRLAQARRKLDYLLRHVKQVPESGEPELTFPRETAWPGGSYRKE